jgi:opine dehydrogenase
VKKAAIKHSHQLKPGRNHIPVAKHTSNHSNLTWAVIGGGNGGQSLAGHLALMGFSVRLYDIFPETIAAIRSLGGIQVSGAVSGFGKVDLATTDIAQALDGADSVMIVAPAVAHRDIATSCAPHLVDGQIIFVHPGATGGALEFKKILEDHNCMKALTLAEANSLLYACRSPQPGYTNIFAVKNELMVAALPATATSTVLNFLNTAFPQMVAGTNVMQTSLSNPNAMMHPAPTLLNTSLIESDREWLYYWDGITPSIGAFVEAIDAERVAVAQAFGLKMPTMREWYKLAYGAQGATLSEVVRHNQAYAEVKGQKTLYTRYLLEDIPMGLVPMVGLGKLLGVGVGRMETVVKLGEFLTGRDLTTTGRTLENLGLTGMTAGEIQDYLETGVRKPATG